MNPNQMQNKPIVPPKKIEWIACRASEACDGNQAYCTLLFRKGMLEGGGTTRRYRCCACNGVFSITV